MLVQTPRLGYAAALACERCRTAARCSVCQGPLAIPRAGRTAALRLVRHRPPGLGLRRCAGTAGCAHPSSATLRTAEELGRTFPSTAGAARRPRVRRCSPTVGPQPAIVVATPGAEPVAEGGYAAVVLLDTWLMLARPDLRTAEEAVRRWANAIGLVRPGGRAVAVGDPAYPGLQALVRWDLGGFAARESAERASAHLPPASRLATITGEPGAVDDALTLLAAARGGRGARPGAGRPTARSRVVVRVPRAQGADAVAGPGGAAAVRSARKLDAVRIQVDPPRAS